MLIEICAYDIRSCLVAEKAGANRIELCAGPAEGGVTPSLATYVYSMEQVTIPIYVMVRPRGGNFVYDTHELAIMEREIEYLRSMACKGIVTGAQLPDGALNEQAMRRFREIAYPMPVTCHKVFDTVPDPFAALEFLADAGYDRVLTSGCAPDAEKGAATLQQLVDAAGDRIVVMPGGGIRATNLVSLIAATGATEYHSSGLLPGKDVADLNEVASMTNIIKLHNLTNTN